MAQQQAKTYQYDLFSETGQEVDRPYDKSEAVRGAQPAKALQVKEAGEQGRALAPDLMGAILCHSNIKQAYKQVRQNKGVAGIDQMAVGGFAVWYAGDGKSLLDKLYNGTYQPQGVKQVEIPKPGEVNANWVSPR